jgi:hypothetical protein
MKRTALRPVEDALWPTDGVADLCAAWRSARLQKPASGRRPGAVVHLPGPGSVHHGASVGFGSGGGDGATGVQDEAASVAEQGDELTRFGFDERACAERYYGPGSRFAWPERGDLRC